MNKVSIVGRLARDPEVRRTQGENANAVARFSVAVSRRFKNAEGNYEADFINCVAFGKTAEFIEKYFKKGMMIGITGRIQTGNYTNKDGQKVYTTDVVIEETEFVESKNSSTTSAAANALTNNVAPPGSGFANIPEGTDEELPFA